MALTGVAINDDSGTRTLTDSSFQYPALIDSGTTSQDLPGDLANAIWNGLGAVGPNQLVACSLRNSNASLTYSFGGDNGPSITVPISEVITLPDGQSTFTDGTPECSLAVNDNSSGNGVILGDSFMRSGYFVFDIDNNQLAMAQAVINQTSTSNIVAIPSGTGLPGVSSTATLMLPSVAGGAGAPPPAAATTGAAVATNNVQGKLPSPDDALWSPRHCCCHILIWETSDPEHRYSNLQPWRCRKWE